MNRLEEGIRRRFAQYKEIRPECEKIASSKYGEMLMYDIEHFASIASIYELDILVEKGNWLVKKICAPYCSPTQLDTLIKDESPLVRAAVANVCSEEQLTRLVRDEDELVRAVVARRIRTRDKYFAGDESLAIRLFVATVTEDDVAIRELATDDSELVRETIAHRNLIDDGAVV